MRRWLLLPWAAGCCLCVGKLRTVLPLTVGIRDSAVQLVSTLGSAVIPARAELGSIIASALPVATLLTRQRVRTWMRWWCTAPTASSVGMAGQSAAISSVRSVSTSTCTQKTVW
jgi:hypothetical protein